jgi:hypothetical protein
MFKMPRSGHVRCADGPGRDVAVAVEIVLFATAENYLVRLLRSE